MHSNTDYKRINLDTIYTLLAEAHSPKEIAMLMEVLFTPSELDDLASRWEILKRLHRGDTQRAIAAELHLGLCKITRGSRELKKDNALIKSLLDKMSTEPNS